MKYWMVSSRRLQTSQWSSDLKSLKRSFYVNSPNSSSAVSSRRPPTSWWAELSFVSDKTLHCLAALRDGKRNVYLALVLKHHHVTPVHPKRPCRLARVPALYSRGWAESEHTKDAESDFTIGRPSTQNTQTCQKHERKKKKNNKDSFQ